MSRAIIFGCIFNITSILLQVLLFYYFPITGYGFFVSTPIMILSSIIFAFIYLQLSIKRIITRPLLFESLTFSILVIVSLQTFPQENYPPVPSQLYGFFEAFFKYDEIKYSDIYIPKEFPNFRSHSNLGPKYIAAIHKFQDSIPYDGSYSIYLDEERNISHINGYDPILRSREEIHTKLQFEIEKVFYGLLDCK